MTAPPTSPGPRRSRLLLAGALVVMLGGFGVWSAVRGDDTAAPGTVAATQSGDPAPSATQDSGEPVPQDAAGDDAAGDDATGDDAAGDDATGDDAAGQDPGTGEPPADAAPDPSGLETVPPREVEVLPSVPLTEAADLGQVTARLAGVARVDGEAQGPGERSGPAVHVRVELRNDTAAPLTVDYVVVDLADATGRPGSTLLGDPRSAPFSGAIEPGAARVADYVLRLPDGATEPVTVTVSYGAEAPTAVFTGPVPAG